ncbi:MAG TPA: hypothetical protein VKE23_07450, partial [Candidatus Limnocylindria bacterium]|nr:hypothetical protein [Candidatus Limnocylindria bacterium]
SPAISWQHCEPGDETRSHDRPVRQRKVRYRGANLEGKMHGPWKFFRRDGTLMRSGLFENGKQIGLWRTFDKTGKVVKETNFSR